MATQEHDDALAGMDYEIAKSLPRNPYTHSVQAIPEGHGPQPNLAQLNGPMYPGGLLTPEAHVVEQLETNGGFPKPLASEYGDEKTGTEAVGEAQGVVTSPNAIGIPDILPGYSAHKRMFYQDEQANKTPNDWNTQQRTVPSVPGNIELLLGANKSRKEVVILNSGAHTCYIGRTENTTSQNGYPIDAGVTFTLETQGPIYVTVDAAEQTTLNIIETIFSTYKPFDQVVAKNE